MSATREIVKAYRGFGASMRRQIESSPGEERLLVYVVIACLIYFVARVPDLLSLSASQATEEVSSIAVFITNLVGSFFFAPLMLYGLAAMSHIIARAFKGSGSFFNARLALFWALLITAPIALITTIIQTAFPAEWLAQALWMAKFLLFAYVWACCLSVAENYKTPYLTMSAIILTAFLMIFLFRAVLLG